MAVARLSDGSVWVWSPVALTEELSSAVEAIGPVRHIVSPNKIHHLFSSPRNAFVTGFRYNGAPI